MPELAPCTDDQAGQEEGPGNRSHRQNRQKKPPRLGAPVGGAGKTILQLVPDKITPQLRKFQANHHKPAQRNHHRQQNPRTPRQTKPLPIPSGRPGPGQRGHSRHHPRHRPLRQEPQPHAQKEKGSIFPNLTRGGDLDQAGQRRRDPKGQSHVEGDLPPQPIWFHHRCQNQRGTPAHRPSRQPPPHPPGQPDHPKERQSRWQASRPLGNPEDFVGNGVQPVDQRGLVELFDPVEVGHQIVAVGGHLPADLGESSLVRFQQPKRAQKREHHTGGKNRQTPPVDTSHPLLHPSIMPSPT